MRNRRLALLLAALERALPLGVALSIAFVPATVLAETDRYKQHMDNGVKLFSDRNYPAAIAEFEAAYEARPKASPLINQALCYKAQFRYQKAIETLETALSKHSDTMEDADRQAAAEAIAEMRALLGFVRVTLVPPAAKLTVDGQPPPSAVATGALPLAPGMHVLAATLSGHGPVQQEVRIVSGETRDITLTVVQAESKDTSAPQNPPPSRPIRYSTPMMVTGIVIGSIGVLSGLGGLAIYAAAGQCEPEATTDICKDPGRSKGGGIALMIAGGVSIAVALPLLVIGNGPPEKPKAAPKKTAMPAVRVGPTSAALRWSF